MSCRLAPSQLQRKISERAKLKVQVLVIEVQAETGVKRDIESGGIALYTVLYVYKQG